MAEKIFPTFRDAGQYARERTMAGIQCTVRARGNIYVVIYDDFPVTSGVEKQIQPDGYASTKITSGSKGLSNGNDISKSKNPLGDWLRDFSGTRLSEFAKPNERKEETPIPQPVSSTLLTTKVSARHRTLTARKVMPAIDPTIKSQKIKAIREQYEADRIARELAEIRSSDIEPETYSTKSTGSLSVTYYAPNQKKKKGIICTRCGGDGGVNGGCEKCDGTGWI